MSISVDLLHCLPKQDSSRTVSVGKCNTPSYVKYAHEIVRMKGANHDEPKSGACMQIQSKLAASRQGDGAQVAFTRSRFKIRRDQILEDAFNHLNKLSEESLCGSTRVPFIHEFGVEEVGIDGGAIFKDFMEYITRAAFDVQYGLFKRSQQRHGDSDEDVRVLQKIVEDMCLESEIERAEQDRIEVERHERAEKQRLEVKQTRLAQLAKIMLLLQRGLRLYFISGTNVLDTTH